MEQHNFKTLTVESEIELLTLHKCGVVCSDNSAAVHRLEPHVSFCGIELVINGSKERATLGGVLFIDDRPFGLTIAHAFEEKNEASIVGSSATVRFYDSSGDEESDSAYTDEGDDCPPLQELSTSAKDSAAAEYQSPVTHKKKVVTSSAAANDNEQGIPSYNYDCLTASHPFFHSLPRSR